MTKHNFVSEQSEVTFNFNKKKNKPPVTLKWYEGGLKPDILKDLGVDKMKDYQRHGMVMVGDKNTLITGGRPNNPKLLMSELEWEEFLKNAPEKTIPRIVDETPVQEWVHAIKNGILPLSNFDYGASLTEMALLGCLAQRFNADLKYDSENMQITNRPDVNEYIKEPVREGWSYGESL
jgi:hypothetical protein